MSKEIQNIIDICELVLKLGIKYSVLSFEATLCIYIYTQHIYVCVDIYI